MCRAGNFVHCIFIAEKCIAGEVGGGGVREGDNLGVILVRVCEPVFFLKPTGL